MADDGDGNGGDVAMTTTPGGRSVASGAGSAARKLREGAEAAAVVREVVHDVVEAAAEMMYLNAVDRLYVVRWLERLRSARAWCVQHSVLHSSVARRITCMYMSMPLMPCTPARLAHEASATPLPLCLYTRCWCAMCIMLFPCVRPAGLRRHPCL